MKTSITSAIDDLVAAARQRYAATRQQSEALHRRAVNVMPGGNTRTVLHFEPFPFRVVGTDGAVLRDADDHRYVDLLGNYTAGFLGHAPAPVRTAVERVLHDGWSIGAAQPREVELAELICARFASIEQVRFTNSGTEANVYAIAAALHHTQRHGVLVFEGGYHGGVLSFGHGPSPINVPYQFTLGVYNDIHALEALVAGDRGQQLGCAVVEPMLGSAGCIPASDEFLQRLRQLCTRDGVVLIFDEVMTSRLAPGGAQQLMGVTPDMTTLGKYLGGGFSFGAFGGTREIMSVFGGGSHVGVPLAHAGTFNNNPISMAAGVAALREVLTDQAVREVNARGDACREALAGVFAEAGLPMCVSGRGSMIGVHGCVGPVRTLADLAASDNRWKELYFFAMLEHGYYLAQRGFIALSLEVTDEMLDGFVTATRDWAGEMATLVNG
ncbi:MAG: aspartate aminotransferase family protein [Ilumatobacteraceae bacterium]